MRCSASPAEPQAAAERAARVIHDALAKGLAHADLNLKNILLSPGGDFIVDLDRCILVDHISHTRAGALQRRFLRSLDKWQDRSGRVLPEQARHTLENAFRV